MDNDQKFELKISLEVVDGMDCVLAHLAVNNGEQVIHHDMLLNLETEITTYVRTVANQRTHQVSDPFRDVQHKSFFEGASLYGPMVQWLARGIGGIPRAYLTLTQPPITQ